MTALAPLNPMQEFPFILIENQSHQEPILNEHQHTINNICRLPQYHQQTYLPQLHHNWLQKVRQEILISHQTDGGL